MSKSLRSIALCIKENLKELDEIDFLDRNVLKTYFKDRQKNKRFRKRFDLPWSCRNDRPP